MKAAAGVPGSTHGPRRSVLAAVWGGLIGCALPAAGCGQPRPTASSAVEAAPAPVPVPTNGDARVRLIVTFTEPPVAARFAGLSGPDVDGSRQRAMQAYAESLRIAKAPRLEAIRQLGGVVLNTLEHSANAVFVEVPAARADAAAEAMRRLPGVASVQPAGTYSADR